MKNKRPQTKLAGKIEKADLKEKKKKRESKKEDGPRKSNARVHPIGDLNSQYISAENELERVGAPE
jgi:hypothetical protein